MSALIYLFLLLLLNKCSCPVVNCTSISVFFIASYSDSPPRGTEEERTDSTNRIIIFSAVLMLLVLFGIFLCKICSRSYRSPSEMVTRPPSLSSLDRLVRERMQDCPPTYVESQRSIPVTCADPPPYSDTAKPCGRCAVFTITKIGDVEETDLVSLTDDLSQRSAPPDYAVTEGVINPAFVDQDPSELIIPIETQQATSSRWTVENHI